MGALPDGARATLEYVGDLVAAVGRVEIADGGILGFGPGGAHHASTSM